MAETLVPSDLAAAGTLFRPVHAARPRLARRIWLIGEMALFYIGAPVAIAWTISHLRVPLFLVLVPILVGCALYLLWDDEFEVKRELWQGIRLRQFAWIMLLFPLLAGIIAYATWNLFPGHFLGFPRYRPKLWLFVMAAYPLLSVLPQEIIYRTFFFHRYGPLFGDWRRGAILANGLLFGFAHILFGNWIAVAGTVVFGWLFAWRYVATRSLWAVWIEHSLYGCLVFTIGLGGFFFTGVSNM